MLEFVSIIAVLMVLAAFRQRGLRWLRRKRRYGGASSKYRRPQIQSQTQAQVRAERVFRGPGDASDQLRHVMSANFSRKRLMSAAEYSVFRAAEQFVQANHRGYRVMAQTSMGELLSCDDELAFRSINSKRVDVLIIDGGGLPLLAVEYQGAGHHQGTAAARDAVKREALRRAGIGFVEIFPDHTQTEIHSLLESAFRRNSLPADDANAAAAKPASSDSQIVKFPTSR